MYLVSLNYILKMVKMHILQQSKKKTCMCVGSENYDHGFHKFSQLSNKFPGPTYNLL